MINDRHKGAKVFVFGNGPSLNLARPFWSRIRRFVTVGVNRIYLAGPVDYIVFSDFEAGLKRINVALPRADTVFLPTTYDAFFQAPDRVHVWRGGCGACREDHSRTLFMALEIARRFGAGEIALLGVDLADGKHFYWSNPGRVQRVWAAMVRGLPVVMRQLLLLAGELESRGVKCWNCSEESAVVGWTRIDLEELLTQWENGK